MKPVAPEKIRHEPHGPEEPPLSVAEEAGELDSGLSFCTVIACDDGNLVPDVPLIVLHDLVVHHGAEVEEVAQGRNEDQ